MLTALLLFQFPSLAYQNPNSSRTINYSWAQPYLEHYQNGILENSSKMIILFEIITQTLARGDRLLVFSQSLLTLNVIEKFLQERVVPGESVNWQKNVNYFRIDGSTSAHDREKYILEFNKNRNKYLFLLSTRAGCLGINLVGANRIVVFDASWNPCHDAQAACRIFRYGQVGLIFNFIEPCNKFNLFF